MSDTIIYILDCPSEQDERWNITWPTTFVGEIPTESCPGGNKTRGKLHIAS